ncbi:Maf family nucleotide pyrophosphatase [Acidiluteibacter ferrifornacis]|uniref:dTTP/UTP pyrophosphatase n=1 Tax=Acidiluteibacter ferrifornacis TaxID=2692424 RepID=A0A6N9NL94_9FLAO|nr:Maf family nucleotide pyrophosphatase [Acidiluteibacter ferrifornacis]MBR9831045.1 septum formation protein Maf [bacterium]NBG67476.1 septum formation protein Maf [Acidiluteibacter ferrifornacis]
MLNKLNKKVILASKSPRRQELLKGLCIDFEIRTKDIDESYPNHLQEAEIPSFISEKKAAAFADDLEADELLITSDTVVCLNGKVLEKPKSLDEGKQMLRELSGQTHTVYSAVCLLDTKKKIVFCDQTEVTFKPLDEEEIEFYINQFQPLDKAGAYGVQEWIGYIAIQKMTGSYYTVMGMPMHLLYDELKKW